MCGIVGYVGEKHPKEILLDGLKKLEYRGYDSSGIALLGEKGVQILKSVGRISKLEHQLNHADLCDSNIGIAHTRWATHGEPTVANAHPHRVGRVTLVHNGIIENAGSLKKMLKAEGVIFQSDTDTEVACALINKYYDGTNPVEAINKAMEKLRGSYAFAILFDEVEKLFAVRKDSPLIFGVGKKDFYIASDISAIIKYTDEYILLDDYEVVEVSSNGYSITRNGREVPKKIEVATIREDDASKGEYKHFMLKEIMEEPTVLEKTLNNYINDMSKMVDVSSYEDIHIVACGSALYAGMIGKALLEEKANIKCFVECASEYRYEKIIYDRKTLVILVSQSGETADTIAAMRKAKEAHIDTLGIVNVKTSTIARECDNCLFIEAGPEIAVATTKAYLLQVAMFSLIALKAAQRRGLEPDYDKVIKEAKELPKKLENVLKDSEYFRAVAEDIYSTKDAFFIGRGIDYAMCLEGSLKLKEVSYIHSDAFQAGELKHGTISLIDDGVPVFAIITDDKIKDKTESNVIEVEARKAKVFTITNDESITDHHFRYVVEKLSYYFQPILVVPPLQLVGYYVADLRKLDIDKPRNLAKSVTVE